jgi:hypothetical protein
MREIYALILKLIFDKIGKQKWGKYLLVCVLLSDFDKFGEQKWEGDIYALLLVSF